MQQDLIKNKIFGVFYISFLISRAHCDITDYNIKPNKWASYGTAQANKSFDLNRLAVAKNIKALYNYDISQVIDEKKVMIDFKAVINNKPDWTKSFYSNNADPIFINEGRGRKVEQKVLELIKFAHYLNLITGWAQNSDVLGERRYLLLYTYYVESNNDMISDNAKVSAIKTKFENLASKLRPSNYSDIVTLRSIFNIFISSRKDILNELYSFFKDPVVPKKPSYEDKQIKVNKLEQEIKNLEKKIAETESILGKTSDPKKKDTLRNSINKNKKILDGKKTQLKKEEANLGLEKKPKLPVDETFTGDANDSKKIDKKVKDNFEKVGANTGGLKNPQNIKVVTSSNPSITPVTSASQTLMDIKVANAVGVKDTTLNFFKASNPLAAIIKTPTQLWDGDMSDARRYEMVLPFSQVSDVPAYIKLIPDLASPVSFDDTVGEDVRINDTSTKTPPSISDPFVNGYRYNQFTLNTLAESHNERYQLVDSMDQGQVIFSFGKKPEIWAISGSVINDVYNNWLTKLREVWEEHLRLSKLVQKGKYARIVIPSQRLAFNCYPIGLTITHGDSNESLPSFTMALFIREYKSLSVFPFKTNSASANILQNLLYLDGVDTGSYANNKVGAK